MNWRVMAEVAVYMFFYGLSVPRWYAYSKNDMDSLTFALVLGMLWPGEYIIRTVIWLWNAGSYLIEGIKEKKI